MLTQLVAGTGVSTAAQLLSNLLDAPLDGVPKVQVLYAAQSLDATCMLPELAAYQKAHPDKVSVRVWVEKAVGTAGMLSGLTEPVPATLAPKETPKRGWLARPTVPTQYTLTLGNSTLPVTVGRIQQEDVARFMPHSPDRLVLVCGPNGFVQAMAGDRGRGIADQGALGGALAHMAYTPAQVVKMQ